MNKIKAFLPVWFIFLLVYIPLYSQTWETYTCKNDVQDLCCVGDYCWVATTGGVVKVNINDFSFEEFDCDDGFATSYTTAVLMDYDKKIWFGSYLKGITIWDSINMYYFNSDNSGLRNNHITCMTTDEKNKIWIGTWHGAYMFDGRIWEKYRTDNSDILDDYIYSICVDKNDNTWFSTSDGISVLNGNSWHNFTRINGTLNKIFLGNLTLDHNNNIWTTGGGIYNNNTMGWSNYKDTLNFVDKSFKAIFIDDNNNKWFGTTYGRVYCFNDTTWAVFDSTNSNLPVDIMFNKNIIPYPVNAIKEDKNGNFWIATKLGLYFYNGSNWREITISNELQSNYNIEAAIVDRENRIWVNSSKGVYVCENNNWRYFDIFGGTGTENMFRLAKDYKGQIWASWEHGLYVWDGSSWKMYDQYNSNLPTPIISAMAVEDSIMWFGSWANDSIVEFNGEDFITHCDPEGKLKDTGVYAIAVDSLKNKWVGTSDLYWGKGWGVARYDGANWVFFNKNNSGIVSNNVEAIAVEDNGCIWFGTPSGVSCFDGENWTTYNTDNSGLSYNYVFSIAIDKKGQKWFGTYRHGLCMFDGENWTAYTKENSNLVDNGILSLSVDNYDNILIGTENGFSIFKQTETGIDQNTQPLIPKEMNMLQNYPNPFNSETKIQYHLTQKGHVKIQVYNIYGQLVSTLYNGEQTTGNHTVQWQGVNSSGETVASGIYFYRLTLDGQTIATKRLVFLK